MKKKIFTVGYEIPGHSEDLVSFNSNKSLMDADILLISPEYSYPSGRWVEFTSGGGGCYDVETSKEYEQKVSHFKKEMEDFLNLGKNIFIFLSKKENYTLAHGVSHPRKGENTYNTYDRTNYDFIPVNLGTLISASGSHVEFSGSVLFGEFYEIFRENLKYQLYIEDSKEAQIIFTGRDKAKILGAVYEIGKGHVIVLPYLEYNKNEFIEYREKEKKSYWTEDAMKFGYGLVNCFTSIDQQLKGESLKTPIPAWVKQKKFSTKKELLIENEIQKNEQKIEEIKSKNLQLSKDLIEEHILRDLLFEQGKPLENAVTKALSILGYQAENYNDGVLELDQVIISPEKHRFIGECEGKDNKDINITKYRQLLESLNADFDRDEIEEKAFGILFGNPQRLINIDERNLDFTQKCKIGAKRDKIALIKTTDLFLVAQYLKENKNERFKKACRNAIYAGLGKIVEFPRIPKK